MPYAIRKDGLGWRAVNGPADVGTDELYSVTQPPLPAPSASDAIKAQIAVLEASLTQRRLREALISGDNSFVQSVDAQIAVLRAQL